MFLYVFVVVFLIKNQVKGKTIVDASENRIMDLLWGWE